MNDINIPIGQMGWICPQCGAVLSPTTTECPHCMPIGGNVETGSGRKTGEWFVDSLRKENEELREKIKRYEDLNLIW